MITLKSYAGETLHRVIREVSPIRYETIKKRNRLLDGSLHVQAICNPIKYIDFVIISSLEQVERINFLEDKDYPFTFTHGDIVYTGYMDKAPSWKRLNYGGGISYKSFYEANIAFIIEDIT